MLLAVNSSDRLANSVSSTNFTVRNFCRSNISSVELKEVTIPNTLYKVNSSNNKLYFNDGSNKSITLASGNYNAAVLCAAIQTALNVASLGFTVTFDGLTMKVTIARIANFQLLCTNTSSAIWDILGYSTASNKTGSASYTADNILDLGRPFSLYLNIEEVGNFVFTTGGLSFTYRIPFVVDSSGILQINSDSFIPQTAVLGSGRTFPYWNVTLRYGDNSIVDLNGANIEIVLFVR